MGQKNPVYMFITQEINCGSTQLQKAKIHHIPLVNRVHFVIH
jgi:hypothetical protein